MQIQPVYNISLKKSSFKYPNISYQSGVNSVAVAFPAIRNEHLVSKFNVNFRGNAFDNSCRELEDIICRMLEIDTDDFSEISSCAIKSAKDIDNLNEAFKRDSIGDIIDTGISLNSALTYLAKRGQIEFSKDFTPNTKTAFMIDRLSIEYLSKARKACKDDALHYKYNSFVKSAHMGRVQFYILSDDNKKADGLMEDFMNAVGKDFEIKKDDIKIIENSSDNTPNYPDTRTIKAAIEGLADLRFKNSKEDAEKFKGLLLRYLKESIMIFSYQTLSKMARKQYFEIEKAVKEAGKTMEDVVYIIPEKNKSYSLVNYIFAETNGISGEKFIHYDNKEDRLKAKDKILVVLDDYAGSGESLFVVFDKKIKPLLPSKGGEVIFSPLVSSEFAKKILDKKIERIKETCGANFRYLPVELSKDFGTINNIKVLDKINCLNGKSINDSLKEETAKFKGLSIDDINYLCQSLACGYIDLCASIIFPYLIPDVASDITAILGGYCLNRDTIEANKPVVQTNTMPDKITKNTYDRIREYISSKNSDNIE